jgi:hypothetical protein
MTTSFMLLFLCLPAASQNVGTEESTRSLIEIVRRDPSNLAAIGSLAKRTDDLQVIPVLKDVFAHAKISRAETEQGITGLRLSQVVAMYLINRGVRDDLYFEELAKYARETIAANPPDEVFSKDLNGQEDPGRGVAPAFELWCAKRNMTFAECWRTVPAWVVNLTVLTTGLDPRAIGVLREALKMSNHVFVGAAVSGLGKLDDATSIPLIYDACSRFSPAKAERCALFAEQYRDARVEVIFDRFVRDPETRERLKKERRARAAAQRPRADGATPN